MGRSPCCDKVGLKKGPWTPEENQKLLAYIEEHGHGSWRSLPSKAGLQRCGKSCRLRWTNYLRPDIKRGKFSLQEEQTIIQLHALLGNRWSAIATHLQKRTDNEIKNYWNTHLKKRLAKMGIDPVTHKPKNDALHTRSGGDDSDGQSKSAAKLSHMAQWESARLEAEARLVRESKIRSHYNSFHHDITLSSSTIAPFVMAEIASVPLNVGIRDNDLESPTSTLTFSETAQPPTMATNGIVIDGGDQHSKQQMFEFVGTTSSSLNNRGMVKEDGEHEWINKNNNCLSYTTSDMFHDMTIMSMSIEDQHHTNAEAIEAEGFTDLLLNSCGDPSLSDSENGCGGGSSSSDYHEENKNYWNNILNLVDSSPSDSPMF